MTKKIWMFVSILFVLMGAVFVPSSFAAKKVSKEKIVYLTFDDGPNTYTPEILDVLKKKKVKATFFMIEPHIKQYPNTVKRLVKEGHYPGLHSVTHDSRKLYSGNGSQVVKEMDQTRKTLKKIAKFDSRLVRVPYGSKPYMKKSFRDQLYKNKYKMWDWNIDTLDWKYTKSNPGKITQNVKAGLKGKKGPIVILFHDSKGTLKELPKIIDYLKKKGYKLEVYQPENHLVMNFWGDKRL